MLNSVRARLTLWYTAIVALVLIIFSGFSYFLLAREIRVATDASLADTAHEFAAAFVEHPRDARGGDVLLDYRYSDREIMVLSGSGRIVASSRSHLSRGERDRIAARVRGGLTGFTTIAGFHEGGVRLFVVPITVLGLRYFVVAARTLDEQTGRLESAAHAVLFGIPLALLVAAAGGYVMARKSLAPVAIMSQKAREISAATLTERIAVGENNDELSFLASTLNDLLARLERAFESQRGFMAEASHELRTPLSIIQGEADVALSRTDRSADDYRESLALIRKAARKVTRIVENLFLLARSDAGRYPIARTRFYLDELVADAVRAMRTVAGASDVQLSCQSDSEMIIVADEALLHRMLLNLIDNAVKFTPPGGSVLVQASPSAGRYLIRVSDTGSGIVPGDRERIFDRFFRGERRTSAGRPPVGAGLGLPIARWIAEVHGGEIAVTESSQSGTTFVVSLPRGEEVDAAAAAGTLTTTR